MKNEEKLEYRVEVLKKKETDKLRYIRWFKPNGQSEGPGDLPAEISFYPSGNIERMTWFQAGFIHRDGDRPANIIFKDNPDYEVKWAVWYQYGKEHRDGHRPSGIMIDEEDGRVCLLQFCHQNIGRDNEGLPGFVWIEADGSTVDEDGYPIDFDLSRLGEELPQPPKVVPPPILLRFD